MIQNEQENDHHSDIHTKDWFSPALASMARLNQIQANVHNMGFHSMSSLKASRNAKQRAKPPLPTGVLSQQNDTPESHWEVDTASRRPNGENENQNGNRLNYKELESTPPLSTVSYQRSAWGSDHSIPELIAQQGKKTTKLRPSSAKGQISARSKRPSKGRPQSAKEPLCSDRSEQDTQQEFEVCGQRKNLSNSRPPSRGSSAPSPNLNTVPGGGWAGLPPGHVIESGSQTLIRKPIVPPSSPVPGESDEEDMIDFYCPQTPPPLLRRPLPQPIHLSLPSVSESADVMRDSYQPTSDDMDTQRLLVQADLYVDLQKTKEKGKEEMENILVSRNTTLPDHYDDGDSTTDEGMDSKRITINISDRSQPKNNNVPSKNKQTHSAFLMPDDNTEHSYQPLTLVEGSKNDRTRAKSAPLRRSKESGSVVSKAGVRIREDRNVTVDITPRNIGRKVKEEGGLAPPQGYEMKSNNYSKKQEAYAQIIPPRKMNRSLVSMVTVEYPTGEVENIDSNDSHAKVKGRKTKTMGEVETMVSHLSKLSHADDDAESMTDSDCYSLVSQSLRKSEGEKNYYEISRSQSRQSNLSSAASYSDKNSEKDTSSFVYKTTKTIEFDKEDLKENSTKMAINTHSTPTPKVNVKQRPPILPSTIKQQKTNESRGKHISEKTETGIDELAEMLKEAKSMAVTSLYDASQRRRPPSGKKTGQRPSSGSSGHTSKTRPFSAGSKLHSTADSTKEKKSFSEKPPKSHPNYMTRTGSSNCCRSSSSKAAKPSQPVVIKSVRPTIPMKTPESDHCRKVQSRMAELGIDVDPRVLEKALFAPAGESLYYEVPGNLPKNPTEGLLSHYKYWLSEDYKRIQIMEKRLAQDDHIRELQRLAAEKKAKKAAEKESKGKKKKKKRKLERSNSIV